MVRSSDPDELFVAARSGDRASLARLLSLIERGGEPGRRVGRLAYPESGRAYTVGYIKALLEVLASQPVKEREI